MIFNFSGLFVSVETSSESWLRGMETYWAKFKWDATEHPPIWFKLSIDPQGVIEPSKVIFLDQFETSQRERELQFSIRGGQVTIRPDQTATFEIAEASDGSDYSFFIFLNLFLPALATRLIQAGGLLLHAAGAVLDDRAFLLVGEENAGKTTWSELCHQAGGTVVNDDVVVLLPENAHTSGFRLYGVPLRLRGFGPSVMGNWPVAALLLPEHGSEHRIDATNLLKVHGRVLANWLYFGTRLDQMPELAPLLDNFVKNVPARNFTFAKNSEFVPLLKSWSADGEGAR